MRPRKPLPYTDPRSEDIESALTQDPAIQKTITLLRSSGLIGTVLFKHIVHNIPDLDLSRAYQVVASERGRRQVKRIYIIAETLPADYDFQIHRNWNGDDGRGSRSRSRSFSRSKSRSSSSSSTSTTTDTDNDDKRRIKKRQFDKLKPPSPKKAKKEIFFNIRKGKCVINNAVKKEKAPIPKPISVPSTEPEAELESTLSIAVIPLPPPPDPPAPTSAVATASTSVAKPKSPVIVTVTDGNAVEIHKPKSKKSSIRGRGPGDSDKMELAELTDTSDYESAIKTVQVPKDDVQASTSTGATTTKLIFIKQPHKIPFLPNIRGRNVFQQSSSSRSPTPSGNGKRISTTRSRSPVSKRRNSRPKSRSPRSRKRNSRSRSRTSKSRKRSPRSRTPKSRKRNARSRSRSPASKRTKQRSRSLDKKRYKSRSRSPKTKRSRTDHKSPLPIRKRGRSASSSSTRSETPVRRNPRRNSNPRSPPKAGRKSRSEDRQSKKSHRKSSPSNRGRSLQRRSSSPNVFKYRKIFPEVLVLQSQGKWDSDREEQFKKMEFAEKALVAELKLLREELIKDPKTHEGLIDYNQLWETYWENKYKELKACSGGIDPDKFNYMPGFRRFWELRVDEIIEHKLKTQLEIIRQTHGFDQNSIRGIWSGSDSTSGASNNAQITPPHPNIGSIAMNLPPPPPAPILRLGNIQAPVQFQAPGTQRITLPTPALASSAHGRLLEPISTAGLLRLPPPTGPLPLTREPESDSDYEPEPDPREPRFINILEELVRLGDIMNLLTPLIFSYYEQTKEDDFNFQSFVVGMNVFLRRCRNRLSAMLTHSTEDLDQQMVVRMRDCLEEIDDLLNQDEYIENNLNTQNHYNNQESPARSPPLPVPMPSGNLNIGYTPSPSPSPIPPGSESGEEGEYFSHSPVSSCSRSFSRSRSRSHSRSPTNSQRQIRSHSWSPGDSHNSVHTEPLPSTSKIDANSPLSRPHPLISVNNDSFNYIQEAPDSLCPRNDEKLIHKFHTVYPNVTPDQIRQAAELIHADLYSREFAVMDESFLGRYIAHLLPRIEAPRVVKDGTGEEHGQGDGATGNRTVDGGLDGNPANGNGTGENRRANGSGIVENQRENDIDENQGGNGAAEDQGGNGAAEDQGESSTDENKDNNGTDENGSGGSDEEANWSGNSDDESTGEKEEETESPEGHEDEVEIIDIEDEDTTNTGTVESGEIVISISDSDDDEAN